MMSQTENVVDMIFNLFFFGNRYLNFMYPNMYTT